MVDDGRRMEQPSEVVVTETSSQTANPSLKLKINLRDRQAIRKRHRSSSPANSSDSSSTYGSTRSAARHRTATVLGDSRTTYLKRNRRELSQRRHADDSREPSPQPDTPPPSNEVGSPAKRNGTAEREGRHVDLKRVRIGTGGSLTITERRTKPIGLSNDTVLPNNILLVDMNCEEADDTKADDNVVDPSGSPPESPVDEQAKAQTKLEAKVEASASRIVKRLSRAELERLVMEQMCLAIRERGVTGELERKLEAADAQLERYRRRSEALHKQVTDLELVVRRFVQQSKTRNQPISPPAKMTRSVGLQINLASNQSLQLAALRKHADSLKPAVTIAPAVPTKVATIVNAPQPAVTSSANSSQVTSPNGSSNNSARVPVPPSFTMQSPDIASYVPQQAVPRYRTPQKRAEEMLPTSKIATYVNIGGVKSIPGASGVASKLARNSVNITPVIPSLVKQRTTTNTSVTTNIPSSTMMIGQRDARIRSSTTGDIPANPTALSQSIDRWSKVPSTRATTVNKVTLPGRLPNVIDLTDEDLEKERAAAAASRLAVSNKPVPKTTTPTSSTTALNGLARGAVAVKSTTLNGRNPTTTSKPINNQTTANGLTKPALTHPAPLPPTPIGPINNSWKPIAPKPSLDIKRVANGIVLSWNMQGNLANCADIASYQLFAYQEGTEPPTVNGSVWKRVGDVKALPLPMACTLTQFLEGHRYHFAVRAMDVHGRAGPYSDPGTIVLS